MSIQIVDDATTPSGLSDDDAVASLMASMGSPKGAPEDEDEGDEDEDDAPQVPEDADEGDEAEEGDEDETDEGDEAEEGVEGDKPETPAATDVPDDAVVKVTVDGEEMELTVGSLKRLAGQEASLTRKSQEADNVGQQAAAVIQGSLSAVLEDLEAYSDVDWTLEGSRMDPEEFAWHREQFTTLAKRRETIVGHARQLEATLSERRYAALQREAVEAQKVLSDPKTGIAGWNDALYNDIRAFAISSGLPAADVDTIFNPAVIKLINNARLYAEAQKVTAQKVNLTPRRVRSNSGDERIAAPGAKQQAALQQKLAAGRGTDDDAQALLMGRWGIKRK